MNNFIERKVEEFNKKFIYKNVEYQPNGFSIPLDNFLRQALQEQKELIMSCLPEERKDIDDYFSYDMGFDQGMNYCRSKFIKNIEEKV